MVPFKLHYRSKDLRVSGFFFLLLLFSQGHIQLIQSDGKDIYNVLFNWSIHRILINHLSWFPQILFSTVTNQHIRLSSVIICDHVDE